MVLWFIIGFLSNGFYYPVCNFQQFAAITVPRNARSRTGNSATESSIAKGRTERDVPVFMFLAERKSRDMDCLPNVSLPGNSVWNPFTIARFIVSKYRISLSPLLKFSIPFIFAVLEEEVTNDTRQEN